MDKYDNVALDEMSRTKRNQEIYNSSDIGELSRIKTNNNVSVISDAKKEIDIEKIRRYVDSLNDSKEEKRKRVSLELPEEEKVEVKRKEVKDYDINSILERAKDKRETDYEENRHRKLDNTGIDILKNIHLKEEEEVDADPDITGPIDELNTEEKTIVDLIQDIQKGSENSKKKDLFEDLMGGSDDTIVAPIDTEASKEDMKEVLLGMTQDLEMIKEPANEFTHEINVEKEALKELSSEDIEKELSKLEDSQDLENTDEFEETSEAPQMTEIDKSFFTNSTTFSKADFEGYEDLEKDVKKNGVCTKIATAIILLLLIATIVLILNFIFDWNLI